jgi:hypothetical protein
MTLETKVDGEEVEFLAVNHAFRAVALEPDVHTVDIEYNPISFHVGVWRNLATVLVRWNSHG